MWPPSGISYLPLRIFSYSCRNTIPEILSGRAWKVSPHLDGSFVVYRHLVSKLFSLDFKKYQFIVFLYPKLSKWEVWHNLISISLQRIFCFWNFLRNSCVLTFYHHVYRYRYFNSSLYTLHLMENLQSEDINAVKVSFSWLRTTMYDTWVVHCTLLTQCTMAYSEDFEATLSYAVTLTSLCCCRALPHGYLTTQSKRLSQACNPCTYYYFLLSEKIATAVLLCFTLIIVGTLLFPIINDLHALIQKDLSIMPLTA